MNQITITITISVPEGCTVAVGGGDQPSGATGGSPSPSVVAPVPVVEPAKVEEPTGPKLEDLKAALVAAFGRVDKIKVMAKLREFGAARASEVKAEQYGEVITALENLQA